MKTLKHFDNPILFLATANAEQSRTFYEGTLGLKFIADEPAALGGVKMGWSLWTRTRP